LPVKKIAHYLHLFGYTIPLYSLAYHVHLIWLYHSLHFMMYGFLFCFVRLIIEFKIIVILVLIL
jgi:hypothetical protein